MSRTDAVGRHLLADLHGVRADLLGAASGLETVLRRAAIAAGARILGTHFHRFGTGGGITGVVLLAESHMSIHTWPETAFAALDIFMCGAADPEAALALIVAELSPARHEVKRVVRGSAECVSVERIMAPSGSSA